MKKGRQRQHWENLAKTNSKYYIYSSRGKNITDEQFKKSGEDDYIKLVKNDKFIFPKDSILDFGCGTGRMTQFMVKDYKKVIGIDISPTMIKEAKKKLNNSNIEFLETNGFSVSLPENSVDVVFAYHVFQHLKEKGMAEKLFGEIYKVLKDKGVFKVLLRSDKQPSMEAWWSGFEYPIDKIKIVFEEIGFRQIKLQNIDEHSYWLWLQKNSLWNHGKKKTLGFYEKKLPWKAAAFNKKLHLPKYFKDLIGNKKEVNIAEIGSGMFCTIGSVWDGVKINMYASDILADDYNEILKKHKVKPLIPVKKENMEDLSYPDNFFDIVHCVNALDHTVDAIKALKEMYRVTKPGGYVYLRHFPNVAESEGYYGMHTWNIDLTKNKDCIIWNKENKFLLSDFFENISNKKKKEMDYENTNLVVTIIQK